MAELQDAVKQCVARLERYRRHAQRIGEQNTKAGLIEPVIGALGWDVLDPEEVHREYRRRGSGEVTSLKVIRRRAVNDSNR